MTDNLGAARGVNATPARRFTGRGTDGQTSAAHPPRTHAVQRRRPHAPGGVADGRPLGRTRDSPAIRAPLPHSGGVDQQPERA